MNDDLISDPGTLVFILSVLIWDLQCKSHFNRKMVFRVTKSLGWGGNIHAFSGGLSANE